MSEEDESSGTERAHEALPDEMKGMQNLDIEANADNSADGDFESLTEEED